LAHAGQHITATAGALSLRLLLAVSADDEADNKLHCNTLHHCYAVVKLV